MKIVRTAIIPPDGCQFMEVDFKGIEVAVNACVIGSTKIETIDGAQSIRRIIKRLHNKDEVYVYGYNKEKGRICVSKVTDGGITQKNTEIWKVVLDNGVEIKATPNHPFMLRNGEYEILKNLQQGDSLMPFYQKTKMSNWGTIYREVYLNNGQKMMAHNLIAEDVRGVIIKGSNKVVHHKNGNGCDNSLVNTPIVTRSEHMKIHSKQGWENHKDRKHWLQTEEGKNTMREFNKKENKGWSEDQWKELGKKISKAIEERGGLYGKNNPMFGKKHSKESNDKNSKSHIGKPAWNKGLTKETNENIRLGIEKQKITKKNNPIKIQKSRKGLYKPTKETNEKIRKAMLGRKFSDITISKLKQNKKEYWIERKKKGKIIECAICKQKFISISASHLRCKHNITMKEYKETYNHKVISVEFCGYDDVYNINVDKIHNYALSSGVIVKNCYNKDTNLVKYVSDPTTDMHRDMAIQIFKLDSYDKAIHKGLRYMAKNGFVFPQFYGDYYKNCANNMACTQGQLPQGKWKAGQGIQLGDITLSDHLISKGIKSFDNFVDHIKEIEDDFWGNRFEEYTEWKDMWWKTYKKYGYFTTLTGFQCSGVMDKKMVCNYPSQGSAFHCLLKTFIDTDILITKEKLDSRLIGQIHDSEIICAYPDEVEYLKEKINKIVTEVLPNFWKWINVPLSVEYSIGSVNQPWSEKIDE
jgi:hypothetical protein